MVVALPKDVLSERVTVANAPAFEPVETSPGDEEMTRLGELLAESKNPAIRAWRQPLVGGRARSMDEFADLTGSPIATSYRRSTLFDPLHPLYAGDLGLGPNPKLVARAKTADLLVLVGGRLGEIPSQGYSVLSSPSPQTKLVHIHPGAGRNWPGLSAALGHPRLAEPLCRRAQATVDTRRETRRGARQRQLSPRRFSGLDRDGHATSPATVNLGEIMVCLRDHVYRPTPSSPTARATTPPGRTASTGIAIRTQSGRTRFDGLWHARGHRLQRCIPHALVLSSMATAIS